MNERIDESRVRRIASSIVFAVGMASAPARFAFRR